MKLGWLFSERWQAIKFVMIVGLFATFQLAVHGRVDHQLHNLNARGFISNRLESYSRLEKEFFQVYDLSHRFVRGIGGTKLSEAKLALDVLWSRIDTLNSDAIQVFGDYRIDMTSVVGLKNDLPAFDAAIGMLRSGDLNSLSAISELWEKYRDSVSDFSDAIGAVRAKQLTDSVSDQWELNNSIKTFQTVFGIFGAALLLIMLGEMFWASRVVRRLEASNEENRSLAETDPLTGLFNRRALDQELNMRLRQSGNRSLTTIAFDIERFRSVNHSFGHAVGDKVLVEIGKRLKEIAGDAYVARMAGDEFMVLLDGSITTAKRLAERIRRFAGRPIDIGDRLYAPSLSASIAWHAAGTEPETVIRAANVAIQAAKEQGRARIILFTDDMMAKTRENAIIEADLAQALQDQRIEIAVQPKVRLSDGSVCGFEALARWQHPTLGWVAPDKFCMLADSLGLSSVLGLAVSDRAFQLAATLKAAGSGARMSVNVSPAFGSHPSFVPDIMALLKRHKLSPEDVEFEVTEEAMLSDIGIMRDNMKQLRKMGAAIAIDDFGKGHSNVGRLTRMAVSVLKVDKSTIDRVVDDPRVRAIIKSIVGLSAELGVEVVVEGVETAEQAKILSTLGVERIQGHLVAKAMQPLELVSWLERHALEPWQKEFEPAASRVAVA